MTGPTREIAASDGSREVARWEWRRPGGDAARVDPLPLLEAFLLDEGVQLGRPGRSGRWASLLLGAEAVRPAGASGSPGPQGSPCPVVPDVAAVIHESGRSPAARSALAAAPVSGGDVLVEPDGWVLSWTDTEHAAAVEAVRDAIARGDVYQVNLVGHRSAPLPEGPSPEAWTEQAAARLAALPGAVHAGVIRGEGWAVCSGSPETLVRVAGDVVETRPIKGTAAQAGAGSAVDALRASAKDRAEHVMIVDLERNDLGRVARVGSVEVQDLFAVESWAGLAHAVSTVRARLRDGVGLAPLLAAVLPGGSVTGAPKAAAVSLLHRLEPVGRGPAMGGLGVINPSGSLDLGLTIRTVAMDWSTSRAHLWAGSGLTWSSVPGAEVAEAHRKAVAVVNALAGPAEPPALVV